jgi:hypothetical protein
MKTLRARGVGGSFWPLRVALTQNRSFFSQLSSIRDIYSEVAIQVASASLTPDTVFSPQPYNKSTVQMVKHIREILIVVLRDEVNLCIIAMIRGIDPNGQVSYRKRITIV